MAKPAIAAHGINICEFLIVGARLRRGKGAQTIERHLRTHYDLTPEDYREKWGLPVDYPMVAPNYAKARSMLAKKIGLGRKPAPSAKKNSAKKKPATANSAN